MAGAVLLAGAGVTIALTTPWDILAGLPLAPAARDFPRAALAREQAFHALYRPAWLAAFGLSLATVLLLGLTPLGARVARRLGGRRPARVVAAAALLMVVAPRLASLPAAARGQQVLRAFGLSRQSWPAWLLLQLESAALAAVTTALAVLALFALARRFPRWWWAAGAVLAAGFVAGASLLYPLTVERLTLSVHRMPDGPLSRSLLALAARDGVALRHVLVADSTAGSTEENAYVDGLGPTRQVVLYASLLAHARPAEIRVVWAHELGHVRAGDVAHGTLEGALAAAGLLCLVPGLLGSVRLQRASGTGGVRDPAAAVLLLALVALGGVLALPVQNLVSRRIEARADLSALTLTRDPATFISSEVREDRADLIDPAPPAWLQDLFGNHPTPVQRIAAARRYAWAHGLAAAVTNR